MHAVMSSVGALRSLVPQVDILSSDEEVQEVVDFVAQNARRLLGVETAQVCGTDLPEMFLCWCSSSVCPTGSMFTSFGSAS
jgi:hypothetical protein